MNSPLTKADLKACQNGQYECRRALQEAEKLAACGLDCAEEVARAEVMMKFFEQVQDQFRLENPLT